MRGWDGCSKGVCDSQPLRHLSSVEPGRRAALGVCRVPGGRCCCYRVDCAKKAYVCASLGVDIFDRPAGGVLARRRCLGQELLCPSLADGGDAGPGVWADGCPYDVEGGHGLEALFARGSQRGCPIGVGNRHSNLAQVGGVSARSEELGVVCARALDGDQFSGNVFIENGTKL